MKFDYQLWPIHTYNFSWVSSASLVWTGHFTSFWRMYA